MTRVAITDFLKIKDFSQSFSNCSLIASCKIKLNSATPKYEIYVWNIIPLLPGYPAWRKNIYSILSSVHYGIKLLTSKHNKIK